MGRIAPVLFLLALAACASGPPPALPQPRPVAPPAVSAAPAPRQVSPTSAARGGYAQEVDDLFRALGAEDGRPAPAQARAPGQPTRQVIHTIAPVSSEIAAAETREAQQRTYEENLTGCLDGRFPAFCDHALLTPYDAVRVQQAEHEANLATCLDPAWQHLCRPELLPDVVELPDQAPARWKAPIRSVGQATSATSPHYAPITAAPSAPFTASSPAAPRPPAAVRPIAEATGPARPLQAASREPAAPAKLASIQVTALSASTIAQRLIAASIASYPGRCSCPYIRDRAGRRCGARSAYNRAGGYGPLCFPQDVTPAMIEQYRARERS